MVRPDVPSYDVDIYGDPVILDPYPHYAAMRELGPAVWLPATGVWALTRYDAVRNALLTPETFSSAAGVSVNDPMNEATRGIMLCSDDPYHLTLRRLFARPLQPKALAELRPRLAELAGDLIDRLLLRDEFDAVADLAHYLPLAVVAELVGLDRRAREQMLFWAANLFDAFGPLPNERTRNGLDVGREAIAYVVGIDRSSLVPGGWGDTLLAAAAEGRIAEATARFMLIDYLTPALDTTINATSSAIELFAAHPDQWDVVRERPELIPHAINEVVRLESPIRAFARLVTRDHAVGDVVIQSGERALMMYACANRDPAKYEEPDRFMVTRRAGDHLGFGMGTHLCAGMHLAKLEIATLLEALVPRVARFHVREPVRRPHNTLRGLTSLRTSLERLH